MTDKTLLVLAASLYQLETINTAKRLGYRVITTDNVPTNPGHALADACYNVDTTNLQGVLEIAQREKVDGVISPCTDVSVPTAAYISEKMGLAGPPYESAKILCDKGAFRDFLIDNGLPSPKSHRVTAGSELPVEISTERKWVIKPDKSSGSKGIFVLQSPDEYHTRLPESVSFSPTGQGVIEEYIDGRQGTCEGILVDGKLAATLITDRQTAGLPYVVTSGHSVPSTLSGAQTAKLLDLLSRIWDMLEIRNGPFDCDFVADGDDIYIIEMTPRMGGNSLNTLWRKCYDFDIVEYSVKAACGDAPALPRLGEPKVVALILLGTNNSGKLHYDGQQLDLLRDENWVDYISIDLPIGAPVEAFINGRHRVGEALIYADDRGELDERVDELKSRLAVKAG